MQGLEQMPPPTTVGDVWQFVAAAGWIRDDMPLFSEAASTLSTFVTTALRDCSKAKRKNMRAACTIPIAVAGWSAREEEAWAMIKEHLRTAITTSFRDKRMQACLFTDASQQGWAYVITQCEPGELNKPWSEQRHALLAVNLGRFRDSQKG